MYKQIYIYIYIYMYIYIYVNIYICVCVCAYMCVYIIFYRDVYSRGRAHRPLPHGGLPDGRLHAPPQGHGTPRDQGLGGRIYIPKHRFLNHFNMFHGLLPASQGQTLALAQARQSHVCHIRSTGGLFSLSPREPFLTLS